MLPEVSEFCRLFLLRHPELSPSVVGTAVGSGDAELSRRGRASTLAWLEAFERIDVTAIHASPQRQSADAAMAIGAAKGLEVVEDERLRDQHLGEWEGKEWDDIARHEPDRVRDFFTEFGEVQAPGGESLGNAIERFLEWWHEVAGASVGRTLVVVSSGAMVTGFAAAMLGMRLSRAVCLDLPYAGIGVLDVYANGARIRTWNPGALDPDA